MKTTKKPGVAPAQTQQPKKTVEAAGYDWSQETSTGFENVTSEDLGIPMLSVIQDGSPEVKKAHPDYATKKIEGAEVGDIFVSTTREIVHKYEGEPAIVIPCKYERAWNEWKPRDDGGGFVRAHKTGDILSECTPDDKGVDTLPNGNKIVPTAYFFCLLLVDGEAQRVVVSMKSTQLKKARNWLNLATGIKMTAPDGSRFTPPMFSHKYAITTVPESNELGSWMGLHIEPAGQVTEPKLIVEAREACKSMGGPARKQIANEADSVPI